METKTNFAARLVKLREDRGISQQELADAIGITRQSLSLYEKEKRTINAELLTRICGFFSVSADYLLGFTGVQRVDDKLKATADETGLSEIAIHVLNEISKTTNETGKMAIINFCIESPHFEKAVNYLTHLATYKSNAIEYGSLKITSSEIAETLANREIQLLIDELKQAFQETKGDNGRFFEAVQNLANSNSNIIEWETTKKLFDDFNEREGKTNGKHQQKNG